MGQSMARVTGGIEKRDINPDYQRFADSPKDKLLGKSSLVHVIGELHEFCWLCAVQVLVSFAWYQIYLFRMIIMFSLLQPLACWVRLLGRQSGRETSWVSLWRQKNTGAASFLQLVLSTSSRLPTDGCIGMERSETTTTPPSPWSSPPSPLASWWEWRGEVRWWRSRGAV